MSRLIALFKQLSFEKRLFAGLCVAILGLALWKIQPPSQKSAEQTYKVTVKTLKRTSANPDFSLHGVIQSPNHATISAATSANVTDVLVRDGQTVKKGQRLVNLRSKNNHNRLKQRLAEADKIKAQIDKEAVKLERDQKSLTQEKALLEIAVRKVDRQKKLAEKNLAPKALLDNAQENLHKQELAVTNREADIKDYKNRIADLYAEKARIEALIAEAQVEVDKLTIDSPFRGKVTNIYVGHGDRVRDDDRLVSLFDLDDVEVKAQIPTKYLPIIKKALKHQLHMTANLNIDGKYSSLTLVRLSGDIESSRGGIDGFFRLDDAMPSITLGRHVKIDVILPVIKDIFIIPSQSLYEKTHLFIYKEGRMHSVNVKVEGEFTSYTNNKIYYLVKSKQLKTGDQLITTWLPHARDGLKVKMD